MSAPSIDHGHTDHTCESCTVPAICDCPCETCISARRGAAAAATAAPKSWIQRALDDEWAAANFAGPGCPFCDSLFPCGCLSRRSEMIKAEARREERQRQQEVAAAGCTCTEEEDGHPCPYCDERDDGYGYEDEEDRDDRYEEDFCSGCYPGCGTCTPYFDPSDPWGDGAPEEHRDDDDYW